MPGSESSRRETLYLLNGCGINNALQRTVDRSNRTDKGK